MEQRERNELRLFHQSTLVNLRDEEGGEREREEKK